MFWIQQSGNQNNSGYRLYYAETRSDVNFLPTNLQRGVQTVGGSSINNKCAIGSECFVIESSSLFILTNNGWREV